MHETEVSGEGDKGTTRIVHQFIYIYAPVYMGGVLLHNVCSPALPATGTPPSSLSVSRDVGRANDVTVLTLDHAPEGIQRARFLATPVPHRPSLACSLLDNGPPPRTTANTPRLHQIA